MVDAASLAPVEDGLFWRQMVPEISRVLAESKLLTPREEHALRLRFGIEPEGGPNDDPLMTYPLMTYEDEPLMTFGEVGGAMGVTGSTAQAFVRRALWKLKKHPSLRELARSLRIFQDETVP